MSINNEIININSAMVENYFGYDLDYVDLVNESLKLKAQSILPAKSSMVPYPGSFQTVMPVMIHELGISGFKFVTRYANRSPILESTISMYDTHTGKKLAEIDGDYITNIRTGAVAAHSIELLEVKGYSNIGIMGLGAQARATMKVLLPKISNRSTTLKLLKYKDQHILFHEYLKTIPGFNADLTNIQYVDSYIDVVSDSDVIISAISYTDTDVCSEEYFKKGALLVPIHTRGFMGCDTTFDQIFGDDYDHVKGFKYFDQFKSFTEVADIVTGKSVGRKSDQERIIVYNIGIALHDLFFSYQCYNFYKSQALK